MDTQSGSSIARPSAITRHRAITHAERFAPLTHLRPLGNLPINCPNLHLPTTADIPTSRFHMFPAYHSFRKPQPCQMIPSRRFCPKMTTKISHCILSKHLVLISVLHHRREVLEHRLQQLHGRLGFAMRASIQSEERRRPAKRMQTFSCIWPLHPRQHMLLPPRHASSLLRPHRKSPPLYHPP